MLKYLSLLICILLISSKVKATQGCVNAARTQINTSFQNGQQYWRTPTTASPGCLYAVTANICSIGSANANNGLLGDDTIQECPIDDYVWVMMVSLAGLGYFFIRRNKMALSIA